MNSLVMTAIVIVAFIAARTWLRGDATRDTQRQLKEKFLVSPRSQILDRDVGPADHGSKGAASRYLRADGLAGKPDALFKCKSVLIAGEYKSWNLRGPVRRREFYQVMLYVGMLKSLYPDAEVEGRLVYRNTTKRVRFDPALYAWLLTHRQATLDILNRAGR